jgi:2-methylcitrate dehydratase PrpD
VRAKDVQRIVAKVSDFTIRVLCTPPEPKYRPITHVDAQFSLPYTIAVAICKNKTGPGEFKEEVLGDPEVLKLASKITWELDPEAEKVYPKAYPATVVVTLSDGREFVSHVDYPRGDPENPVTMQDIVKKFNSLTERYFDQGRREKIVEQIKGMEKIDDLAKIADLVR